jgi:hypothetical protein
MWPVLYLVTCLASLALATADLSCAIEGEEESQCIASKAQVDAKSMLQIGMQGLGNNGANVSDCPCDPLAQLMRNLSLLTAKRHTSGTGSFGCPASEALQVIDEPNDVAVKRLVIGVGTYETLFRYPKNGNPRFQILNGAGISHLDSFGYGAVKRRDGSWVLARFDSSGIYFLKKLPGDKWVSGAFSANGDYYLFSNLGDLMVIPDPSQIEWTTNRVSDLDTLQAEMQTVDTQTGDIIVLNTDIGEGLQTYTVSVEARNGVLVFHNVNSRQTTKLTTNLPHDRAWGSGWMFAGGAFFASNDGSGVYQIELRKISLANRTGSARHVGSSEATGGNDGLNCVNGYSPFPGCERFCVDNGCPCLIPHAERCLLKSCEQCPFCV